MAEWARITNTTIHEYLTEQEVNVVRNRKLLALMKEKGRITFNHSGDLMDWKVRYKRAAITGIADADTLTFDRKNKWKTAQLDWRGYASTDSMTKKEKLMNKSSEAIVKIYSEIADLLMEDIKDQFGDELYVDGNASGNEKKIHGLESFAGNSGAYSGGYIGTPSDTYAGLTTGLADYGGSWSATTWPIGTGDYHYDFWSPLIVDYTDTLWAASTKTWPNTCVEALRFGILHARKNSDSGGMVDLAILNPELYRQFLELVDGDQRIIVNRGGKESLLVKLGFSDVTNFDGVDITYEYGVPANVGYGFNTSKMELCSLQGQLFVPEGPDFDIASQSWRFSIDFYGNAKFNPRCMVKWMSIT